jgi:hypothetical protein
MAANAKDDSGDPVQNVEDDPHDEAQHEYQAVNLYPSRTI